MIPNVEYCNSNTDTLLIDRSKLHLVIIIFPISKHPKKSKRDVIKDKKGEIIYELILKV